MARTYGERFEAISSDFLRTRNYKRMYQNYAVLNKEIWADTERKDYKADLWYNLNYNEICLEMLGDLCKGKRVLSIGGGFWIEGMFLKSIIADEIVRTDLIGDEDVLEEDASNLSFGNKTFDIVICREMIEHVLSADEVFSEIRRVLKSHGLLLITTPNAYAINIDGAFHLRGYTPTTFLNELKDEGFSVIKKRGNVPYAFHGLKMYAGIPEVLEDFKEIDRITRDDELRYYLGTQLFVLCRKEDNEDTSSSA